MSMKNIEIKTTIASLSATKDSDFSLFSSRINYAIPGYQRPYEWDEDKIENMMNTLFEFYQNQKNQINSFDDILLFGTIQLNINQNNEYEIIDGQQRLVSFSLLIKVLSEIDKTIPSPQFNVRNYIRHEYDTELDNAHTDISPNRYTRNYAYIKELISEYTDDLDYDLLYETIISRLKFVLIITENIQTIERTLQIFTALNTTGLPLDIKDVFKVKFCDSLGGNTEENLQKINEAYNIANEIKTVNENDILDVYRFYLLSKVSHSATEHLKGSNQRFFSYAFESDSEIKESVLSADDLVIISSVVKQTEDILREKRNNKTTEISLKYIARDLIDWSGYSRLKNIVYYLVFKQVKFKNDNFSDLDLYVENACEIAFDISNICALYRMKQSKIVNEVFEFIKDNIICTDVISPSEFREKIISLLSERQHLIENFYFLISGDGESNIFDNNRIHYFMLLSYCDDCKQSNTPLSNVYDAILHKDKWDIDIEHIHSRKFFDKSPVPEPLGNSLGNLLYLERGINRLLGDDIKGTKISNSEEDFKNKISRKGRYEASELISTIEFRTKYSEKSDWLEDEIRKRNDNKKLFIGEIFEKIFHNNSNSSITQNS